jgi:DNA-binding MarR family transcriptional regulator
MAAPPQTGTRSIFDVARTVFPETPSMSEKFEEDVLKALRRITRAIDLHSKQLASAFGLTGPQLVCLRVIGRRKFITPSEIAREVSLSQATVTGIVDRLAARQLVTRERSEEDRRLVTVTITDAGKALVENAPSPLQEKFAERLRQLSEEERAIVGLVLNKIVGMMDGQEIEAAPVLTDATAAEPDAEVADLGVSRTGDLPIPGGASTAPNDDGSSGKGGSKP